jgi:ATP-dependent DNA helicase RecG
MHEPRRLLARERSGRIDPQEVRRLVAEGEGQLLEFKPGWERPAALATSLAAFANAEGGLLLLGIVERDGHAIVEGVSDVKRTTDHLYTAAEMCTPKFELAAPERVEVDGVTVLVVQIPEGITQVYGVEGHYVAREGSHRRALTPEEIRSLLSRRGLFAFDRLPVPGATRAHLDGRLVRAFVSRFRSGRRMGADALLASRELLVQPEGEPDAPLVPSVAGMLLLGKDPQRFFPQARVAVVQCRRAQALGRQGWSLLQWSRPPHPLQRRGGLLQGGRALTVPGDQYIVSMDTARAPYPSAFARLRAVL